MFGFTGGTLVNGAVDLSDCVRCGAAAVEDYLASIVGTLDIDDSSNVEVGALTDGLLILRWLFGFTGTTLITGAVDAMNCARCTAPAIEGYLESL
jgi:hypothetical protein